jgi:hypothetical protein
MNLTNFAGQNWLITPVALAVGERPPASIHDQKWLVVLTGVVAANLQWNSTAQWLNTNVSFLPDMAGSGGSGPLNWAIATYGIPKPPGTNYSIALSLDEWAPFVGLSAIYDQAQSIDAGYAVNVWRPNHFTTGIDALSNGAIGNIFTGVNADVGVRDTDAFILSFNYNITLRGTIVFPKVPVILFQSNFGTSPANQPPKAQQAVGTAKFNGPILVVTPTFPHTENWLQVGPFTTAGSMFTGLFAQTPGFGVYVFTATMFLSSKNNDANIGFDGGDGKEFLNINFKADNKVYLDVQPTACTFPRDTPFAVQITITLSTGVPAVQIGVAGSVANASAPINPGSVAAVTFYEQAGDAPAPFDVTDVLVTYTAT